VIFILNLVGSLYASYLNHGQAQYITPVFVQ
jgi:hypothetical protein